MRRQWKRYYEEEKYARIQKQRKLCILIWQTLWKKRKDFPVFQMEKLWIKSQKNSEQNAICVFDVQRRTKFSFTIFCNICKKKTKQKQERDTIIIIMIWFKENIEY